MRPFFACAVAALFAAPLLAWVPPATGPKAKSAPDEGRRTWPQVKAAVASVLPKCAQCLDGKFNDLGPLDLNGTLTAAEERTQYVMWSMLTVPTQTVGDSAKWREETKKLLANEDLKNVGQDFVCRQAYPVAEKDGALVLIKDCWGLNGANKVVAFYNPTDAAVDLTVPFAACELGGKVTVNDLLDGEAPRKDRTVSFGVTVPPHGVKLYRMFGQKALMRRRYDAAAAVASAEGDALLFNYVYAPLDREYALTVDAAKDGAPYAVQVNGLYLKRGCVGKITLGARLYRGDNFVRIVSEKGGVPKVSAIAVE